MTALLDRLREALAPDYEVEREAGAGGMGVVFLGRDVALDRRVAIKIIRPELATATAAERFVREARILASLSHPNIIPVHRAGESRGLFYYVMDYVEAQTLADRLAHAPLPVADAVALGKDVLSALEAAHRRGVVHRDVKPANIFLLEGRAVLADFGIAKDTAASGTGLTAEGRVVGSPGYMAPEQMAGGDVATATDLYAVGLILYEALTGQPWPYPAETSNADWSRVPAALVPVLQRALAWSAADRWRDAAQFRRALEPARPRAWPPAVRWVAAALVVVGVGLVVDRFVRPPPRAATLRLRVRPFAMGPAGQVTASPRLGDSLAIVLAQSLGGNPDFTAELYRGPPGEGPEMVLRGSGEVSGDSLRLTLSSDSGDGGASRVLAAAAGPLRDWRSLVSDSLARQLLLRIWSAQGGKLAADLPRNALPRTRSGLEAWIDAERLFARAEWASAYAAYSRAIETDSSCLLCRVRLTDVGRWIGRDNDTAATTRYRSALAAFPPHYRRLIEASFAPHERRFALLDAAAERWPDFGLAWFIKGDEIFHRGPLDGYLRHDALAAMQRATQLWPDFAPAWEHLSWIALGEGDSAVARHALETLAQFGGQDEYSVTIRTLLDVCSRWRFGPPAAAQRYTLAVLRDPRVAQFSNLSTGARYLMTCDVPAGSVWLGEAFQSAGQASLETPGLLAEIYGNLALGKPQAALAAGRRVRARTGEPAVELFLAELPVALRLADSAGHPARAEARAGEVRELERFTEAARDPAARRRAAWLLALYQRSAGDAAAARRSRALLGGDAAARPFALLAEADAEAAEGRPRAALRSTEPLLGLDSAGQAGDPFFRAFLHLMRAGWHASQGDTDQAVRDLRWHENNDLRTVSGPAPGPEAAELDWALGTLARWRRARLLGASRGAEACAVNGAVARLWAGGETPFAARADSARRTFAALGCGGNP